MVTYESAFRRHLSFFDRSKSGTIHYLDSLRGNLSLGLDFPVALVLSIGQHLVHGNVGLLGLRGIRVHDVKSNRTMLRGLVPSQHGGMEEGYTRTLLDAMKGKGLSEKISVWALAADSSGRVSVRNVGLYQKGKLLPEIERGRKYRNDVLPFLRGGPISYGILTNAHIIYG